MTVADRILAVLRSDGALTYAQIAARTGDHEPSVRRASKGLEHARLVRWAGYADSTGTDIKVEAL